MKREPVFILAAARSGTKLIRNILAASSDLNGPNYDANYVWMHGAYDLPHDERAFDEVSEKSKKFINEFLSKHSKEKRLLEKTVSNALRIPFLQSMFPKAQFVHLVRDGRDVVSSSYELWNRPQFSARNQPSSVMLRKIFEYPIFYAHPYLRKLLIGKIKQACFGNETVVWGPRYRGIDKDISELSKIEVCARQREKCVLHQSDYFHMSNHKEVRYEKMIASPKVVFKELAGWLNLSDYDTVVTEAIKTIDVSMSNQWQNRLNKEQQEIIQKELSDTLSYLGYTDKVEPTKLSST